MYWRLQMLDINRELKEKIANVSSSLESKYKNIFSLDKYQLRDLIKNNIGEIKKMKKLGNETLTKYQKQGGIVGVDGSNNKVGGAFPHYIEIYQALAKSTFMKDKPLFKTDIYTPLLTESLGNLLESEENKNEDKKNERLATLEVEAAIASIDKLKPYAIMMDGGLIRYNIYSGDKWTELKTRCEEEGIILFGIIKDIKTSIIADTLIEQNKGIDRRIYDREILFGVLDYGEMILIQEFANKKESQGYASVFLRSSLQPSVIGMDIIDSQREHLEEMANLVFTLTPENSRGVPLWLDIVDQEVKLTDQMTKSLLETHMDREIYQRFFLSERAKR